MAPYRGRVVEDLRGQTCADYVYAIGGDRIGLAREGKLRIGDVQIEVLAHLMLFDHGADGKRDRGGAARRVPPARDGRLDARQPRPCKGEGRVRWRPAVPVVYARVWRPDRDCGKQSDAHRVSPGWKCWPCRVRRTRTTARPRPSPGP